MSAPVLLELASKLPPDELAHLAAQLAILVEYNRRLQARKR